MSNQPLIVGGDSFNGPLRMRVAETDGEVFIPGFDFMFDVGTWTATRGAQGNWFMRKTAAANTPNPAVFLTGYLVPKKIGTDPITATYQNSPSAAAQLANVEQAQDPSVGNPLGSFTARIRGFQIKAFDVVYAIGTAALNTHTVTLNKVVHANNAAPVVTQPGGTLTGALAVNTQAQPYVTTVTLQTPYVIGFNTTDVSDVLELAVNAATTSVYDLYGVYVRFNYIML